MIPNGLNPHGLENKTLTFVVLENNSPVYSCQSKNRLYCWAVFPQDVKNYINNVYGRTDYAFSIRETTEDNWSTEPKYVSKGESGNWFMVQGDQTFYWQVWRDKIVPDFATIYVLDTSGTMREKEGDYTEVKKAITSEIYDYNCIVVDKKTADSKMYVFSAANLSSMSVADSVFGTIHFGQASLTEIWNTVSPFIDKIKKNTSSESMITNLYYSIADIIQRMFYGQGHTNPGKNCDITAATFVLLTDESIFTTDTLNYVRYLSDPDKPTGKNKGIWYSSWFAKCVSQNNDRKTFPLDFPDKDYGYTKDDSGRKKFCATITNWLRQLSYYYGVNFTWGLYGGLSTKSTDIKSVKNEGTAPWLNKVNTITRGSSESITYSEGDGVAWTMPSNFHVGAPHESMCRIALEVPTEFIDGDMAFKKDLLAMQDSDQFQRIDPNNPENSPLLKHFWRDGINVYNNDEYSAFRFLNRGDFVDHPVYLPQISSMNLKQRNPNTGLEYQYKWQTYGQQPGIPSKTIACGGEYSLSNSDDLFYGTSKWEVHFKLIG